MGRTDGRTDGRTNGRTDEQTYPLIDLLAAGKKDDVEVSKIGKASGSLYKIRFARYKATQGGHELDNIYRENEQARCSHLIRRCHLRLPISFLCTCFIMLSKSRKPVLPILTN